MRKSKYRWWLRNNEFLFGTMDEVNITKMTVGKLLFTMNINKDMIDKRFDEWVECYLEDAIQYDCLPMDIVLLLLSIDKFSTYIRDELIRYTRKDYTLMDDNAYDTILLLLCNPEELDNIRMGRE